MWYEFRLWLRIRVAIERVRAKESFRTKEALRTDTSRSQLPSLNQTSISGDRITSSRYASGTQ